MSTVIGLIIGMTIVSISALLSVGPRPAEAQQDLALAAQKAQVMAVIYQLDSAGLHDLDVKLNNGEFVAGALGRVRRARIATQATQWPQEVQPMATELVQHLQALEGTLRDEDVAAAARPVTAAHDVEHNLSDKVYGWLSGAQSPGGH